MSFVVPFAETVQQLNGVDLPQLPDAPVAIGWESIVAAVAAALDRGETHYTDRPGILPLREQVAQHLLARFGITVDAKSAAVITCGLTEARFVALQQLLAPGDAVWAAAAQRIDVAGATLLRRALLTDSVTDAKLLCFSSKQGEAAIRGALQSASASSVVLFEVDESTAAGFHPAQVPGFADRTLTAGQLGYGSWQLGYLVAPPKLAAGLRDFKQALTICSTNLSQWAALAAMERA